MCDECYRLTDILITVTRENERLRYALSFANAHGDADLATTIEKAIRENAVQTRIVESQMKDHDVEHETTPPPLTESRAEQENRLMDDYAASARHYAVAVNELTKQSGSTADFNTALDIVKQTKAVCEAMRMAL